MLLITNLTKQKVDEALLKKVAHQAAAVLLATPNPPGGGEGGGKRDLEEISLVLVGEAKIKALNKKYLKRDGVTDVLSFEQLNEIFICLPQARKQAKLLKTPLKTELTRLLVHGIVHLKGYEHERSAVKLRRMEQVESKILDSLSKT